MRMTNDYRELLAFLQRVENFNGSDWATVGIQSFDDANKSAIYFQLKTRHRFGATDVEAVISLYFSQVYNATAKAIIDNNWVLYKQTIQSLIGRLRSEQLQSPVSVVEAPVTTVPSQLEINSLDELREVIAFYKAYENDPSKRDLVKRVVKALETLDFSVRNTDGTRVFQLLPEDYNALVDIIGVDKNISRAELADDLTRPYPGKNEPDTEELIEAVMRSGAKVVLGVKVTQAQLASIVMFSPRPGLDPILKSHFAKRVAVTDNMRLSPELSQQLETLRNFSPDPPTRVPSSSPRAPSSPYRSSVRVSGRPLQQNQRRSDSPWSGDSTEMARAASVSSVALSENDLCSSLLENTAVPVDNFIGKSYQELGRLSADSLVTLESREGKNTIKNSIGELISKFEGKYNQIRREAGLDLCCFRIFQGATFLERALEYAQKNLGVPKSTTKNNMNSAQKLWVFLQYAQVSYDKEGKPVKRTAEVPEAVIKENANIQQQRINLPSRHM